MRINDFLDKRKSENIYCRIKDGSGNELPVSPLIISVIPAKTGIQGHQPSISLDPGFRRDDDESRQTQASGFIFLYGP